MFRRKRKVNKYHCYYLVIHFPSAEEATKFSNTLPDAELRATRMLRGGERLQICEEPA